MIPLTDLDRLEMLNKESKEQLKELKAQLQLLKDGEKKAAETTGEELGALRRKLTKMVETNVLLRKQVEQTEPCLMDNVLVIRVPSDEPTPEQKVEGWKGERQRMANRSSRQRRGLVLLCSLLAQCVCVCVCVCVLCRGGGLHGDGEGMKVVDAELQRSDGK